MTDGAAVCLVASLLLNSVSIVVSTEPSETCPVFCVCDNWYELQRASCTGRHLYSIDTGAPSTVQALDLSDNVISYLNDFALANAGSTSLKYLNLSGNAISEIGLNAFAGLEELTVVDLTKNHLYYILDNVFAENSHLRILKLSRNNFNSHVPKLRSIWLTELSLDSCQISHLPSDTFNGLTHIRRLDLSNNLMIQMSSAVVQTSHFLKKLSLEGNPWSCNRIMFDLQAYLQHKNIEHDEVCGTKAGPKKFEKMILGPMSKQQNYHRSAIKNQTVHGAKSVIRKNNTASLLNEAPTRGDATGATNVVDSVRNILPYWFLAVGFLLGAASGMIVSYVWLSGKFSCSRGHGHRGAHNDPSQGLSLLLNSYLRDSIDSDANVVGSCPGTPPPPYREVMLRPTLYRCPQTATNLNNNATGYRACSAMILRTIIARRALTTRSSTNDRQSK